MKPGLNWAYTVPASGIYEISAYVRLKPSDVLNGGNQFELAVYRNGVRITEALNSPSAHMCTGDELHRSASMDHSSVEPATGAWYSSPAKCDLAALANNCQGWLDDTQNREGPVWGYSGVDSAYCDGLHKIACCD